MDHAQSASGEEVDLLQEAASSTTGHVALVHKTEKINVCALVVRIREPSTFEERKHNRDSKNESKRQPPTVPKT